MTDITNIDCEAIEAAYGDTPVPDVVQRMLEAARAWDALDGPPEALSLVEAGYDAAKREMLDSDIPIPWQCAEDGEPWRTVLASDAQEALSAIEDEIGEYDLSHGTVWVEHRVCSMVHNESESETIALEPDAPACREGHDHDWDSPHELLGGLKENPGVWGKGGGVTIREVCAHCGTYRITDTWAQRSDTGEQGLRSVAYEDADEASLAWVRAEQERC